jgi:hypothetical protein
MSDTTEPTPATTTEQPTGTEPGAATPPEPTAAPATEPAPTSETPPTPATPPAPPAPADPQRAPETPASPSDDPTTAVAHWKEMARKNEKQAKENYAELQKLRAQQDPDKAQLAQLAEEMKALRAENEANKRQALLAQIAEAKQLTIAQARRLQGSTKEELLADADQVIKDFGIADRAAAAAAGLPEPTPAPAAHRPTETLRPGASPDDGGDFDPAAVADRALQKTYRR